MAVTGRSLTIGKHSVKGWKAQFTRLEVGTIRPRLWREDVPGFRLDLVWGRMRRPVVKFWRWEFWCFGSHKLRGRVNPWNSGNHWFVLDIPWLVLPFIAFIVPIGRKTPGGYLGARTADQSHWINWALVKEWVAPGKDVFVEPYVRAWGMDDGDYQVMEVSVTLRDEMLMR